MRPLASLTLECTQVCMFLLNAQLQRERRVQPRSDLLSIWRSDADPAARIEDFLFCASAAGSFSSVPVAAAFVAPASGGKSKRAARGG